jgi:hypothetical protein
MARIAEAKRVHVGDRPRAHGEDVAQDAADPRRRALIGLDIGGWLWLSILKMARRRRRCRSRPAFSPGPQITHGARSAASSGGCASFVGAMLDHMTEKMPSSSGSAPARAREDALIFVGGQAVLGHLFGRDLDMSRALAGSGRLANPALRSCRSCQGPPLVLAGACFTRSRTNMLGTSVESNLNVSEAGQAPPCVVAADACNGSSGLSRQPSRLDHIGACRSKLATNFAVGAPKGGALEMTEKQKEGGRIAALKGYGVLDSPNEEEFDAIVRRNGSSATYPDCADLTC